MTTPPFDALAEQVERERYELITASIRRLPLPLLLFNLCGAWLLWRTGWSWGAGLWFALISGVQGLRWVLVRRWGLAPALGVAAANRTMMRAFVTLGWLVATMVAGVFIGTHGNEHYLVTQVCVGTAAGAVVAAGWSPRMFALWSLPVAGSMIAGWLHEGGVAGIGVAVLIAALFVVLLAQTRDQEGSLRRLVGLAWDNARLVDSLRAERDRAQAASRSKTRFFAAASHDLRQPLHALSLSAYAMSMLAQRRNDAKMQQLADGIERALHQSTGLLDGLLDISRLDAGAVRPAQRDFATQGLLDSLRAEFAPQAAQRGLAFELTLSEGAPPVLRTDPDLLRRVLQNLIANALKFTREGSVRVAADGRASGDLRLAVIDTGPGIPEAEQERVFEEFYQLGNAARDRNQGLGLGLSIVRRTCALLGLPVTLHSQPGHGTRVELVVPRGDPTQPAVAPADDAPAPAELLAGLRVLAIDDEGDIRASMRNLLTELGCDVRCADGRDDALALVQSGFDPQVIIADHRLREHNGLDAIAAVRALTGPRPAVVVTGDTAPHTLQQVLAGGHRVLHKPVDGAKLVRLLRELTTERNA
ncbi:MAG: hybrid sensor histidine kinase/response regulator [Burkholderiales bacterium]|nr:hybrid sensor histidine kinase/response regulator [Burkholderiales bacterium]